MYLIIVILLNLFFVGSFPLVSYQIIIPNVNYDDEERDKDKENNLNSVYQDNNNNSAHKIRIRSSSSSDNVTVKNKQINRYNGLQNREPAVLQSQILRSDHVNTSRNNVNKVPKAQVVGNGSIARKSDACCIIVDRPKRDQRYTYAKIFALSLFAIFLICRIVYQCKTANRPQGTINERPHSIRNVQVVGSPQASSSRNGGINPRISHSTSKAVAAAHENIIQTSASYLHPLAGLPSNATNHHVPLSIAASQSTQLMRLPMIQPFLSPSQPSNSAQVRHHHEHSSTELLITPIHLSMSQFDTNSTNSLLNYEQIMKNDLPTYYEATKHHSNQ